MQLDNVTMKWDVRFLKVGEAGHSTEVAETRSAGFAHTCVEYMRTGANIDIGI